MFAQVNDELDKCGGELSKKQIKNTEDLARWWSSHLKSVRKELYQAAIEGAKDAIQARIHEDGKETHR